MSHFAASIEITVLRVQPALRLSGSKGFRPFRFLDSEAAHFMVDSGTLTSELLDKVGTILKIYARVSCPTDRQNIKLLIGEELQHTSDQIDFEIKEASNVIANADNVGLVTTAARFKDELREIKTMLARPY